MNFVTFTIKCGDNEYYDHALFKLENLSEKELITYQFIGDEVPDAIHWHGDTYENYQGELISVYNVKEITSKQLNVLHDLGVVSK
jgi:hypothetical protein